MDITEAERMRIVAENKELKQKLAKAADTLEAIRKADERITPADRRKKALQTLADKLAKKTAKVKSLQEVVDSFIAEYDAAEKPPALTAYVQHVTAHRQQAAEILQLHIEVQEKSEKLTQLEASVKELKTALSTTPDANSCLSCQVF